MNKLRINNYRFSISFCTVAKTYGLKTVGGAIKFFNNLQSPNTKLYFGTTHIRALKLIKELEEFQKSH